MQESTANDFYERLVEGTDYEKTVTLEHGSGATLEVEVHPVDKKELANVIQTLPEEMFNAVEEADNPDEAKDMLDDEDDMSVSAMSGDTVDGFENLVSSSLKHDDLTQPQIDSIVSELDFAVLFELGGDIIDMSFAEGSAIKDFHAQE